MDSIFNRRSIRKYKSDPIPEEKIQVIIRAAMYAPSAVNMQPWHFVVCDDRAVIEKFMSFHKHSAMLKEAPVCIFVCADVAKEFFPGFYIQDCAAATQTLLLEAYNQGLGTCWMGICPRPEFESATSELLNLPDHVKPFCAIAVGYANETPAVAERFKPDRVHRNKW